ncbi:alpha/beta hydrolase [Mycolicibacterium iranicum]|uniref:Alpha/beta hydrolase n=1 Tax=Mycolicibacterium iranicum TaxID=912594 RepID=A0A178LSQ1_MYCIR|nr:alpha/beta hydrolase [Mycolicibacterium iranicum]OAN36884.1 alpha/beta hydrolase [Mycolicibacterium iranicum]
MTVFVLLHGGMHSASCWSAVEDELRRDGHHTAAPDLPIDDDSAGALEWARVAAAALDAAIDDAAGEPRDDVVAVAHSISGLCLPVLATLRSVRRMVFVAGLLPVPGQSFAQHLETNPDAITFPQPEGAGTGPFGLTWEAVHEGFYHDCPEALARRAFEDMRDQSVTVFLERCPISDWPSTPSTYILLRDDRAVGGRWARRNAVDRIGADMVEIGGGHSPFFSRPAELASALVRVGARSSHAVRRGLA